MPTDPNDPSLSHRHKGHAIEALAERWLNQQGLTLAEVISPYAAAKSI